MPIREPAARIDGPQKKLQPAPGKHPAGVVANNDGNFSNNYEGKINCRGATHIQYGEGLYVEYVNQPIRTAEDPDSIVDGVHEYGYREVE
jgi:hypothetical protein